MAFKHNTSLTSDGVLQQGDYESTSGHLLDSQAEGDLIVADSATTMTRLEAGAADTVLTSDGTNPSYNKLTTDNLTDATLVTETDTIAGNDNDTTIPTSAAVKDYVDNQVSGTTLTFEDDATVTGSVDLDAANLKVLGGTNVTTNRTAANEITVNLDADISVTSVAATTPISPSSGGTGANTFTDAGVLIGNGTGAIQATSAGTTGQVLTSNGAGVDPTFQDVSAGGNVTISGTAAQDFTAGDPVSGFNSSSQIVGFQKRSASAGRNWDMYGGGNVSSDVILTDSTSTYSTLKDDVDYGSPIFHYLTGENCILAVYVKESDDYLYGMVGTIASDGATTWGTETLITASGFSYGTGFSHGYSGSGVALTSIESSSGSGKMIVSYVPGNSSSSITSIYHRVLTIVGGTTRSISVGAEATQTVTSGYHGVLSGIEGASGSAEAVLLEAGGPTTSTTLQAVGVTVAGTTITLGSNTTINLANSSSTAGRRYYPNHFACGAYNVTRDSYAVIYYDWDNTNCRMSIRSFTQSGTTLTLSAEVAIDTILSDVTLNNWYQNQNPIALVWDTTNTHWVCNLQSPYGANGTAPLNTIVGVFTEATVGTYAKVGNTLVLSGQRITDSTSGLLAHQYSWNTDDTQGIRAMLNGNTTIGTSTGLDSYGNGEAGKNKAPIVNVNDYTANPYLRYDSADSAWYVQSFIHLETLPSTTSYAVFGDFPVTYKLTFDYPDWTVAKATLMDTYDTNVGYVSLTPSRYGGWGRTIYDPDNDWYIKFMYFPSSSGGTTYALANSATYNATGNSLVGEGFAYMVWDDADVNDYAGIYMTPAANIFGTAANTVTAGGTVTVNIGNHVNTDQSFASAPTGKPAARAFLGPDGSFATQRSVGSPEYYGSQTINNDHLMRVGTAFGTTDLLFGFNAVQMP